MIGELLAIVARNKKKLEPKWIKKMRRHRLAAVHHAAKADVYASAGLDGKARGHRARAEWHARLRFGSAPHGSEAYNAAELMRALSDPITLEMFVDPVVASSGHTFDRASIGTWLRTHRTCPVTGIRLASDVLVPNLLVRSMVEQFVSTYAKREGDEWAAVRASCELRALQKDAPKLPPRSSDERVDRLDSVSIRSVMTQHKDAICAGTFDPPIGQWDVSRVDNMAALFMNWETFDQPIGWDTSNVKSMNRMFFGARAFNHPIGQWDTRNVENTTAMFFGARSFNQAIGNWHTGRVTNMSSMFRNASAFNVPIGGWDTGRVTNMSSMFEGAVAFNQPIDTARGRWDTRSVATMSAMFRNAFAFNQPILAWDTSSVTDMSAMFQNAVAYNNGGAGLVLNTPSLREVGSMFQEAKSFAQEARLSDMGGVLNVKDMLLMTHRSARIVTRRVNAAAAGAYDPHGDRRPIVTASR